MNQQIQKIEQILNKAEDIFNALSPIYSFDDLGGKGVTIAQLRLLLLLKTEGELKVSVIADKLGVSMPTITGITNNLIKKKYITRVADRTDRRLVLCRLSKDGENVMNKLWTMSREQIKQLISGLSDEKLKKIEQATEILLENVINKRL